MIWFGGCTDEFGRKKKKQTLIESTSNIAVGFPTEDEDKWVVGFLPQYFASF